MLLSFAHTNNYFDWVFAGLVVANVTLVALLTFFPGMHNYLTNSIIRFIKKL